MFLETGIDFTKKQTIKRDRNLNEIVTTGRLIKSKNIDQVIEVFQKLSDRARFLVRLLISFPNQC